MAVAGRALLALAAWRAAAGPPANGTTLTVPPAASPLANGTVPEPAGCQDPSAPCPISLDLFRRVGAGYCRAAVATADEDGSSPWRSYVKCVGLNVCKQQCLELLDHHGEGCVGLAWAADPQEEDVCQLEGAPRCVLYYGEEPVKATTSVYQQYDCYMAPMLPAAPAAPALASLGAAEPGADADGTWLAAGFLKETRDLPPLLRAAVLASWALCVCTCLLFLMRGQMAELCMACKGYAPVSTSGDLEAADGETGGKGASAAVGRSGPAADGGRAALLAKRTEEVMAEHGKGPLDHHFRVSLIWDARGVDLDLWLTLPDGQQCGCSRRRCRQFELDLDNRGSGAAANVENITAHAPLSDGQYTVEVHLYDGSTPPAGEVAWEAVACFRGEAPRMARGVCSSRGQTRAVAFQFAMADGRPSFD